MTVISVAEELPTCGVDEAVGEAVTMVHSMNPTAVSLQLTALQCTEKMREMSRQSACITMCIQ